MVNDTRCRYLWIPLVLCTNLLAKLDLVRVVAYGVDVVVHVSMADYIGLRHTTYVRRQSREGTSVDGSHML